MMKTQIRQWGVFYIPTKNGRIFANLSDAASNIDDIISEVESAME